MMRNTAESKALLIWDEIRRIAITELGMTYPNQDQIVTIPDEGSDYVRQLADIDD